MVVGKRLAGGEESDLKTSRRRVDRVELQPASFLPARVFLEFIVGGWEGVTSFDSRRRFSY